MTMNADNLWHWCDDILDVQARFVSAGWHNVIALYNAAVDYGFSGDSFVDTNVGRVFEVLLGCAVTGHRPTMHAVLTIATWNGAHFERQSWPGELESLRLLEVCGAGIHRYAELHARNVQHLTEAREHLAAFERIVGNSIRARSWVLRARPVFAITSQRRRLSA